MMKKNICFVALLLILVSCSAPYHKFNYAVRIKPEKMKKYEHEQLSNTVRNGTALEGEVLGVEYVLTPDSCFSFNPPNYDTLKRISFIDICNSKREPLEDYIEYIPLADIDLVGQHKIHDTLIMPMNEWNNENYFEDYNTPDVTHSIRAVPVTVVLSDTCVTPCPCKKKVDFECLECQERELKWYFFEVKPLASVYSNRTSAGQDESFKNLSIDLAAGVRFGANKQFGLGMLVSPGVKVMNSRDSSMHRNLNLNLYGRWDLFHTQKVKEAKLANQFNADADINERLLVEYELKQLQEVKLCVRVRTYFYTECSVQRLMICRLMRFGKSAAQLREYVKVPGTSGFLTHLEQIIDYQ